MTVGVDSLAGFNHENREYKPGGVDNTSPGGGRANYSRPEGWIILHVTRNEKKEPGGVDNTSPGGGRTNYSHPEGWIILHVTRSEKK